MTNEFRDPRVGDPVVVVGGEPLDRVSAGDTGRVVYFDNIKHRYFVELDNGQRIVIRPDLLAVGCAFRAAFRGGCPGQKARD